MAEKEKTVEIEGAGEVSTENKEIAMLIAVLALVLAITELLGSAAQVTSVQKNIESANYFAFYQGKAIRSTILETAIQQAEADMGVIKDEKQKEAREALIGKWKANVARYESDPKTKEGKEQLRELGNEAKHESEVAEHKHQKYELAIGAFHIAIVLASAAIITGIPALVWVSAALGFVGLLNVLGGYIG